jgi:hypothetical protein
VSTDFLPGGQLLKLLSGDDDDKNKDRLRAKKSRNKKSKPAQEPVKIPWLWIGGGVALLAIVFVILRRRGTA